MILKGSVETEGALSGRLMSESMWANLGQVPREHSKFTQYMESLFRRRGMRETRWSRR